MIKDLFFRFLKYIPWAFIQQAFVVGIFYFFLSMFGWGISISLAVFIFVVLHIPNRFLMIVVAVFETILLLLYLSPFDLIWMSVIHAAIAVILSRFIPESITHGMKVLWNYK